MDAFMEYSFEKYTKAFIIDGYNIVQGPNRYTFNKMIGYKNLILFNPPSQNVASSQLFRVIDFVHKALHVVVGYSNFYEVIDCIYS